jgi:hypothetical protein
MNSLFDSDIPILRHLNALAGILKDSLDHFRVYELPQLLVYNQKPRQLVVAMVIGKCRSDLLIERHVSELRFKTGLYGLNFHRINGTCTIVHQYLLHVTVSSVKLARAEPVCGLHHQR